MRVERIGAATLYCGDCREIAPGLARPAAVISDPPYGQGYGSAYRRFGKWRDAHKARIVLQRPAIAGDDAPFDPAPWMDAAPTVLLWGAHKFADRLPPGMWLVWDKVPTGKERTQGDGEAAWLNRDGVMRIFRHLWDGICVSDRADLCDGRVHPMQKPVEVMRWSIGQAGIKAGAVIMDPYMGSGGTGVAAVQMGHPFVGIEIDPTYFATACRRIEAAQRQADLFVAAPPRAIADPYPAHDLLGAAP
jgi:site-specific DNA-methyltransferase (adenine-specific)/modification methylase